MLRASDLGKEFTLQIDGAPAAPSTLVGVKAGNDMKFFDSNGDEEVSLRTTIGVAATVPIQSATTGTILLIDDLRTDTVSTITPGDSASKTQVGTIPFSSTTRIHPLNDGRVFQFGSSYDVTAGRVRAELRTIEYATNTQQNTVFSDQITGYYLKATKTYLYYASTTRLSRLPATYNNANFLTSLGRPEVVLSGLPNYDSSRYNVLLGVLGDVDEALYIGSFETSGLQVRKHDLTNDQTENLFTLNLSTHGITASARNQELLLIESEGGGPSSVGSFKAELESLEVTQDETVQIPGGGDFTISGMKRADFKARGVDPKMFELEPMTITIGEETFAVRDIAARGRHVTDLRLEKKDATASPE